ncbi:Metallo-dependent phosphatase-like protein, partial [Chytridium lagenaria]
PTRVIAIGDFHGDLPNTLRVLRMAKLIDDSSNWIAKPNTILVQTGDIVDRGDATIPLYELMRNLTDQAAAAGSKVVRTLGNHEVMNMAMDWRYVTPGDVKSFGGAKQRQVAFSKDGWIGKELRALPVVALEEGTVFVHGGVTMKWAEKGIQGINDAAKKAMDKGDWYADVFGGEGVLWYRGYAMEHEGEVCGKLVKALYELKAKRMVMGHTPQLNGRILSRCNHMALIVDVGISSYYGGNCAALEIVGDRVTALYCDGEPQDLTPSKRYDTAF